MINRDAIEKVEEYLENYLEMKGEYDSVDNHVPPSEKDVGCHHSVMSFTFTALFAQYSMKYFQFNLIQGRL